MSQFRSSGVSSVLGREGQTGSGELRKDSGRRLTEDSWRDLVNRFLIKMELKTHKLQDVCTHKQGCLFLSSLKQVNERTTSAFWETGCFALLRRVR